MALQGLPIIDVHSKNADKSELKFREVFSQHNNFIPRPDVPDKGCDFDVELIISDSQSSNWRFPVQLKSVTNLVLVDSQQFISYSFETSRLGYLMRRYPSMGLVVLYSLKEDRCFYDYTDKIYERIMSERNSDDWKSNDSINIRIPYSNILNATSATLIHGVFTKRFEQALIMQNSHGEKYGLPTFSLRSEFKFDFNNTDHIKRFLSEYGTLLLSNYDLGLIYNMITRIPNVSIYSNKDLLLIAAVSYSEYGMFADSELFCNKLVRYELSSDEDIMLQFVKLKNKLSLGYINVDEFLKELSEINISDSDIQSQIVVSVNLIRYKIGLLKAFEKIPEEITKSIDDIFSSIEEMEANERIKGILKIWNAENLSYLVSTLSSVNIGQLHLRESMGGVMPLEERKKAALDIISLSKRFEDIVLEVNKKALEIDDELLKGYSLSTDVRHFISQQINFVSFRIPVNKLKDFDVRLERKVSYSLTAYNYFLKLNLYKDAYNSLCEAIEIIELGEHGYGIKVQQDKKELYQIKKQIERDLDLEDRPIVMLELISKQTNNFDEDNKSGMPVFKDLNDEQLEFLAQTALISFNLPQERFNNLLNEMKAYRLFHQRCNDDNILILQIRDYSERKEDRYSSPVKFVLRSRKSGLETAPNSNMELLLSSWGF